MTAKSDAITKIRALMREHHVSVRDLADTGDARREVVLLFAMCAGAALGVIAYTLLVHQIWDMLSPVLRIVASMAGPLFLLGLATSLRNSRMPESFALWVLALGGLSLPGGIFITLKEAGMPGDALTVALATLAAIGTYAGIYGAWRTYVMPLLGLLAIPVAYFALLDHFMSGGDAGNACIVLGIAYVAVLVALRNVLPHRNTVSFGLMIGTGLVLGGAWDTGMSDGTFTLVYPFLVSAVTYAGFVLHRGAVTTVGALAALGYLSWVTDEYFADSIGWPLALLILALALGAGGYVLYTLGKREK